MTVSASSASLPASHQAVLKQASRGVLPIGELFQAAQELVARGVPQEASALYRLWLDKTRSPLSYAVCFNLAVTLGDQRDEAGAEQAYRQAIGLNPNFVEARLNLGSLLERMGRPDESLDVWRAILREVQPDIATQPALHQQTLNNLGRLLEIRKLLPEAEQMLRRSLQLNPQQPNVITHWVHLRQKLCEWPVYAGLPNLGPEELKRSTSALAMLSASPDPAEQLAAARRFIDEKVKSNVAPLTDGTGYPHKRMRIGYLSSDFCSHAVSILTAELYELHDRSRVEVYAFSWSREDGSPLRARVVGAMDHYIRIDAMTDEEAAHCIRRHEIDLLVDLHGLTLGARPGILAYRPAPVQATWLGFPGPTAIPGVDYVISDPFVLPPELEPYFTEKPLHMPHTFQINDRQRAIGATPTKAGNGLPEDKFIFCSFNNNYKFTPEVFSAWMRILQRVPDSVLWMVADTEETRANLLREAESRGVARERLLFAGRVAPADYLARFQLADLFLDTAPFNAGTTASDALWAGLPVLTCAGRTFSARMAGSLLHAMGLPELVTHELNDYEERAVALAGNRAELAALRQRLLATREASPLFDTPRFVRDLEDLYASVIPRPEGVPLQDETAPGAVPAPDNMPVQHAGMLRMLRNGLHSVAEIGNGVLAQAYRSANPQARYTSVSLATPDTPWSSEVLAADAEQLDDADWRRLGATQCWVFPDTLERLRDPWTMLRNLRRHATGPVEVVACVSNAQNWALQSCLASGNLQYQDNGLLNRANLHWFTRSTLALLLRECGFNVVDMNTVTLHAPPEAMLAAIRQMAIASGADPELAVQDALPYQYLVRAVAA
ncbi:tetratricopeptide repeat protein [Massilia sp. erpn]|uniref:O-linked N-acetylglucosamine transferase, SPINDLY family protein n=1 Tax=Massilia sp. erpn TaxID=2738142 RepID=UPI00210462BA|nr:tetratricopeptide repeat protein [Massilia sp. erpn]UTY57427.1 tetratricopeptide repeat protein [Massilia sp. erpn]